jgi:hypothetical protein
MPALTVCTNVLFAATKVALSAVVPKRPAAGVAERDGEISGSVATGLVVKLILLYDLSHKAGHLSIELNYRKSIV